MIRREFLNTALCAGAFGSLCVKAKSRQHITECPFCSIPPSRYEFQNEAFYCVMDTSPVAEGHRLIIPKRHVIDVLHLTDAEYMLMGRLIRVTTSFVSSQDETVQGYNVGANCGQVAGQSVMHCHTHIIPRRVGDVSNPKGGVRCVIPGKQSYG